MPPDPRDLARRAKPTSSQVEDYLPPDDDPDAPQAADIERFSDVTVKCPECGTELFDDVAVCWKCGRALGAGTPDETRPKAWVVAAVIIVILAFAIAYLSFR